jgi:hypothetical protein
MLLKKKTVEAMEEVEEQDQQQYQDEEAQEKQEEATYTRIEELEKMGISKTDIDKLKTKNFFTVESIAYVPKKKIY